eukprot:gene9604-10591_t
MALVVETRLASGFASKIRYFSFNSPNAINYRISNPLFRLRMISRSLTQAELKENDALESERDVGLTSHVRTRGGGTSEMPVMVPRQAVNKAYKVNQSPSFYAFKPNEKMIWLTKTYLTTEGIPSEIEESVPDCSEDDLEACKSILHQIAAFQRNPKKPSTTFHEEEFSFGLIQDVLRVFACSRNLKSANQSSRELFIQTKPETEMNWFRNFNFYHAKYKPSIILRTDKPFAKLEVDFPLPLDEFPASMPGPFDTYSLGAYEASIVNLKNNIGVKESKLFTKPHVHTIVQVNTRLKGQQAFESCALMTSFTQLLASSVNQGHLSGLSLQDPINCNCIVTNGTSMMLMVYQLNTTMLQDDRGMWNRAWSTPLLPLYTPNEGYPTKRQFHEIVNTDCLPNFNSDAFRLFHKLVSR